MKTEKQIRKEIFDGVKKTIDLLESLIKNPSKGLPEDIFLFVTRITPMISVDLLIKNEQNQTLLTWRDDGYWPAGWHIPGSIIRYYVRIVDLCMPIIFLHKPILIIITQ